MPCSDRTIDRPCCYEVDSPVIEEFEESFQSTHLFVKRKEDEKFMLNLWKANQIILEKAGIMRENIAASRICTACNPKIFFHIDSKKELQVGWLRSWH